MIWRLYHTGTEEIRSPDVRRGRKNADFGQGFYLTPDLEFARRWAGERAVLNAYELDDSGLIVRRFERGGEWFDCIFRNRRAQDPLDADVAAGPIANDTLFDTLGIVSSGFLRSEEALRLLMIGPEYRQVAVRTEKAARQLRWLGAETISGMDLEARRAEQEAYQEAFAAAMAEIAGGGEDA